MQFSLINYSYLIMILFFSVSNFVNGENNRSFVDQGKDQILTENIQGVISSPDGKFIVNTPNSKQIYAVQCGLDVTLFTLKYFKSDYSLARVSIGLPLSSNGISMADIKQMLQCHGLEVDARRNVTLKNILKKIDGKYIVILPMQMSNGQNHYFIIMLNDKGDVTLVNVSRGVTILKGHQFEENIKKYDTLFSNADRIALFVKKNKKLASIKYSATITPKLIELGGFMIGGSESSSLINASFDLINTSDLPIMVSSVQTSCGCTKLEWEGRILKAGEKKEVKFSVIPDAWGRGEQKKTARVSFADGSYSDVTIHGTGQTPTERQRIELSQYSAVIEITDETNPDSFDVRLARLSSYVIPINEIKISPNVPWFTIKLSEQEKKEELETAEINAAISTKEILPLLESGNDRLQGILHISGNKEMDPVEMKVEIFQRDFYRLDQYMVSLSKDSSETKTIPFFPVNENDKIKILNLKPEVDFINVDCNGNIVSVHLAKEKEIKTGYYSVTVHLKNAKERKNLAQITINITP